MMMKKQFMFLFAAAALLAAGATSCSKDNASDDGGGNVIPPGKESVAQLTVVDGRPATYAAGGATEPTVSNEANLAATLDIYIFNENGMFEKKVEGLSYDNSTKKTGQFTVTSGQKYFYLMSNKPGAVVPPAGSTTTRAAFEKQVLDATFAGNNTSISPSGAGELFFIGTLWGAQTPVVGTGTTDSPEEVQLEIGRVAAKVNLKSVVSAGSGNLSGAFDDAGMIYRLRSIPSKYYMVGKYAGTPPPFGTNVTSAVHDEDPVDGGGVNQNPIFTDYSWTGANGKGISYYAIENTSKRYQGSLRFGNTTFVQMKIKYTPDASELYDAQTGQPNASANPQGDFYVVSWKPVGALDFGTFMFNGNPNQSALGGDFGTPVKHYEGGMNYYNFVIKDESETGVEKQCMVLRNHYYELDVTSISNLGEDTDIVDPLKPVEEDKDIVVTVKVLEWSKISQNVEL